MSRAQHIGHWPFPDASGRSGPITRNVDFVGAGCVIDDTAVPYFAPHFPLAYESKEDAMWHFWRVRTWSLSLTTTQGFLDGTEEMLARSWNGGAGPTIANESELVTCHNGIVYRVERVFGTLHFNAYIYVCHVEVPGETQVAYNPATKKWLPKLKIDINYFKTDVPEDAVTVGTGGSPDPFTCSLGGELVNLEGSADPCTIVFEPTEFWAHGGKYDTETGEDLEP